MSIEDEVESLLDQAYESDDPDEVERLVNRALELQPDNPEALLLRADLIEDDDERLSIVMNAINTARDVLRHEEIGEEDFAEDEMGIIYLALLQRLAFLLFEAGDSDEALKAVEELIRLDVDDQGSSRNLYYRILVERGEWQRILDEAAEDVEHQLGWAYARVAASFMLNGAEAASPMFWNALMMAPNVPFYMLGYFAEPDGDSEDEQADFSLALLFSDVWPVSRDMLNWFSRGVIMFGLLSGRFGDDHDAMLEILTSLGGRGEFEEMSAIINDSDDTLIIETLAAHRCNKE